MLIVEEKIETAQILTLEQRRAHLKLSLAERRRQLASQAEKMIEHYQNEKQGREVWQGGDIVEI